MFLRPGPRYGVGIMSGWFQAIVDVACPPRCRGCGVWGPVGADDLCAPCAARIWALIAAPCCPCCGAEVASFELIDGRCHECRDRPASVLQTARVARYDGSVRRMLLDFKFHGREALAPVLSQWLAMAVQAHGRPERFDAVTFVPSHWRHRLMKPLYPARLLAERAAVHLDRPFVPLLRRVHARSSQIGLSYDARRENVRGAFAMARGAQLAGARLLLIDDVRTTGATLEECARVLHGAGASEVFAAVVCKADWRQQAHGDPTAPLADGY